MLPATLYLVDRSQELVREWQEQFVNCPAVEVLSGDYFQKPADAIVSPANSFGIMDGGLDLAIRSELGFAIEQKVQEVIVQKYHGELPVGCRIPSQVCCPAALRIKRVISSGCEISERWPALTSMVWAPIRLAMKRSRSGLMVRSSVETA
jgi:O-acetyl-ADP-ribose deacetylase (regulator of RNase III)